MVNPISLLLFCIIINTYLSVRGLLFYYYYYYYFFWQGKRKIQANSPTLLLLQQTKKSKKNKMQFGVHELYNHGKMGS
jgi:hypothetical protein